MTMQVWRLEDAMRRGCYDSGICMELGVGYQNRSDWNPKSNGEPSDWMVRHPSANHDPLIGHQKYVLFRTECYASGQRPLYGFNEEQYYHWFNLDERSKIAADGRLKLHRYMAINYLVGKSQIVFASGCNWDIERPATML